MSGFFNRVPGQSIFKGATSRFLVMVMFCWIVLHCSQSFSGRALCHGPILGEPLQKSVTGSKGRPVLEDCYVFETKT